MRALTLTQPWAGIVASGIKLIENRPRSMIKREDFGQRFAIHASREIDENVYRRIMDIDDGIYTVTKLDYGDGMITQVMPTDAPWYKLSRVTSAVIGVATIDRIVFGGPDDIVLDDDGSVADLGIGQRRWFFGPVGYVLRDVEPLRVPVQCRGHQGFWTLRTELAMVINAQVGR